MIVLVLGVVFQRQEETVSLKMMSIKTISKKQLKKNVPISGVMDLLNARSVVGHIFERIHSRDMSSGSVVKNQGFSVRTAPSGASARATMCGTSSGNTSMLCSAQRSLFALLRTTAVKTSQTYFALF